MSFAIYSNLVKVEPISMDPKEMYQCLAEYGDLDQSDDSVDVRTDTPSMPLTPHTPSTPASNDDPLDQSTSSVSMDSGVGSPPDFSLPNGTLHHSMINLCSLNASTSNGLVKRTRREHIDNEKKRRDRIKDSCEQLRVLLPYIRGRKTDMASILEMTVDYIKIVNMHMPQNVHHQIVETLQSTDSSLVPNDGQWKRKTAVTVLKKESGVRSVKAARDPSACTKRIKTHHSSLTDSALLEEGQFEPTLAGHPDHNLPTYANHKPFSTLDEQALSRGYNVPSYSDNFSTAQQIFSTYSANKSSSFHEATAYHPGFSGESTLYQYYPSLVPNTSRLYQDFLAPGSAPMPSRSLGSDLLVCAPDEKPHDLNNNFASRTDP